MPTTPRLQQEDLITTCPELQYRASQEAAPRSMTVTMTTTSFTSGSVDATLIGCYAIPEDGSPRGAVRQVKTVAGTTATVDAAWDVTTGVTTIRLWQPADVPIRTTASGGTSYVLASGHAGVAAEPDSFWSSQRPGHFLLFAGGANAGKAAQVTAFTATTGSFSTSVVLTSTTATELAYLRQLVRGEEPPTVSVEDNYIERRLQGSIDGEAPVRINPAGSLSVVMPQKTVLTAAGFSTEAVSPTDVASMLQDVMAETLDTGSTVASVAANSIVATSGDGYSIGGFVLPQNGQAAQIWNIATNTLTLGTGQCTTSSGIAVGSVLYASCWYKRKSTDYNTRTFDCWRGGLTRQILHGCSPTLTVDVSRDQIVRFSFNYTAGEALEYEVSRPVARSATLPITLVSSRVPYDAKGSRFLVDGVAIFLNNLSVDFGFSPKLRGSLSGLHQNDGTLIEAAPMKITFSALADNDDRASFKDLVDRIKGGDSIAILYQKGTAPSETFCLGAPSCTLVKNTFSYNDTQGEFACTMVVRNPQSVPGNAFAATLPAFTMGWL